MTKWNIPSQKGKIIIVTGANSGIGFETAKMLAYQGAEVIMAVRNLCQGKLACEQITKIYGPLKLGIMELDLSDLNSVRKFSEEFHAKYSRLDVLINNAGVMWPKERMVTKQGFELQIGVNHMGHFALTGLLLDLIRKTPGSRVVTQSSFAHKYFADIHFDDIQWEKQYNRFGSYAQSKLANILFTYELDRRFKQNGISAIAAAAHPGYSATNLFRHAGFIVKKLGPVIALKPETGALPILRAATDESLKGGEYFGFRFKKPFQVKSSRKSYNKVVAGKLWSVSEELTKVIYNFKR